MKLNTMKKLTMLLILSSMAMGYAGCTDAGGKKKVDNTALLFLAQSPVLPNEDEAICLQAYYLANSCVAGPQVFNPAVGCTRATLNTMSVVNGTVTQQVTALRSCVEAAVRDATQPCNLTQFQYTTASQAAAGVFKAKCSVAEYAITTVTVVGTTTTTTTATAKTKQDLTGLLKF